MGIANEADTRNHCVSLTGAGTSSDDNVLLGSSMFNLILFKVKLALLTQFLQDLLLSSIIVAILDNEGRNAFIKCTGQHTERAMEAHKGVAEGGCCRGMNLAILKSNFDIIAVAH